MRLFFNQLFQIVTRWVFFRCSLVNFSLALDTSVTVSLKELSTEHGDPCLHSQMFRCERVLDLCLTVQRLLHFHTIQLMLWCFFWFSQGEHCFLSSFGLSRVLVYWLTPHCSIRLLRKMSLLGKKKVAVFRVEQQRWCWILVTWKVTRLCRPW